MGWFADFMFGTPQENQPSGDRSQLTEGKRQESIATPKDRHRETDGSKIIPEVSVPRVECHPSSDMKKLELWVDLYNESPFDVEVRRFEIFGQSTDPGKFLKPGQKYEVRVYRGDTPRTDDRDRASIQYKIVGNGDYFQTDHLVEFKVETVNGERWYLPREITSTGPVRDI